MSDVVQLGDYWPTRVTATVRSPSHRQHEARLNLIYGLYTDDLVRVRRRAEDLTSRIRGYLDAR